MTPNNKLYKQIAEILNNTEYERFYSTLYYLKRIGQACGYTYTGFNPSNKYLKDFATYITGETYTGHHINRYYLREIATELVGSGSLTGSSENYYLSVIAENITLGDSISLSLSSSTVTVGAEVTLTATVLDEDREPIEDAEVTFKVGSSTIDTDTTDSTGKASITYTTDTVGALTITAEYDEISSSKSLTVNKHSSSITMSASSTSINVGDTVTVSGVLKIDNVGTSGLSVDIYDGTTKLNSSAITTSSGGAYSFTTSATTTDATLNLKAKYTGDTTHNSAESDVIAVSVSKKATTLTINTPTIIYSDEFSVTGSLKDANNNAVSGATITMNWNDGTAHTETATTQSDGSVTFSRSAPTSITNYTFQFVYSGNDTYVHSSSSEITVATGKETSVLNVSSPTNNTIISTGNVSVSGTLKDNDDTAMSSKTVTAKIGATTVGTFTTGNDGAFTGTISASSLSDGSNSIVFSYAGDDYYTSSTLSAINVNKASYDTIVASADKSILSYADTESATLYAQLKNNGSDVALSGVTITFKKGDTTIDTATTDATGKATLSNGYTSSGAGDISITASDGTIVSESFVVQDTWKYDSNTYSSNKDYNLQLPSSKYSLEFDILKKGTSTGSAGGMTLGTESNYFMVGCGSSNSYQVARWGTNVSYVDLFSLTHNTWKTIILEVDGSTVDIKADGNTYTVTGISSDITSLLYRINCNNTNINIRNLKIKSL